MIPQEILLAAIKARSIKSTEWNGGILTADCYLKTLQDCCGSELCYRYAAKGNVSFNDLLTKAAKTLTYNNPDMVVEDLYTEFKKSFKSENIHGESIELPKDTLMVFKHTLTSPRKDRDGDILRTKGARPDPNMLLLWQHSHTLPIGKMLGVVEHTSKSLKMISALVDINDLAHDSAVMIDNKMGRFSHGFKALDFDEVKETNSAGKSVATGGFDVKEFEIMEESLVSVPSNVDAEVEDVMLSLTGKGKLTSPFMKAFADNIRSKHTSTSVSVPSFPLNINLTVNGKSLSQIEEEEHGSNAADKSSKGSTKCGCGCNGAPGGCGGKKPESKEADELLSDEENGTGNDKKSVDLEKSGRKISGSNMAKLHQAKDHPAARRVCLRQQQLFPCSFPQPL